MAKTNTSDCEKFNPEKLYSLLSRIVVWGALIAVVYLLQSFFLLMFLTFVFGFVQAKGVERLHPWIPNRPLRVILVGVVFLGLLTTIGLFLVPQVRNQAQIFASQFWTYVGAIDRTIIDLKEKYPVLKEMLPEPKSIIDPATTTTSNGAVPWSPKVSPAAQLLEKALGSGASGEGEQTVSQLLSTLRNIGGTLLGIASAFLLALLFSFLIVLDLPRLVKSVRGLRDTRARFMYEEVAPTVLNFGKVLGRALEAQLYIAFVNTFLTCIGIYFLGMGNQLAFLAVIIFLCGFIPVAGTFISSAPICLIALETGGLNTMLLAIGLIMLIHFIESYFLNPKIYGATMRINPVIVLIILTVGGKLFHVWGLVLGVPLCTYIFGHAIRNRKPSDEIEA